VVGTLADDKALTRQDLTTQGVGGPAIAAVDQAGERGAVVWSATVPNQDLVSGATTAPGVVAVVYHDRA
jgi:hypothetical protein